MVVAFDEIGGPGESFPGLQERKRSLNESLAEISEAAGDRSHVSGAADYVVRIAKARWAFHEVPAPSAFVIVDNVDNIALLQLVKGGSVQSIGRLSADDDWFGEIQREFAEFRARIDD